MHRIRTIQNLIPPFPTLRLWAWGFAAVLGVHNVQLAPPEAGDHWKKIHLPLSLLVARADSCLDSQAQFNGCIDALHSLQQWKQLGNLPGIPALHYGKTKRLKANPFPSLFSQFQRAAMERVPLEEHAEITAHALNAWTQRLDPHARLEPNTFGTLELLSQNEPRSTGLGIQIHHRDNRIVQVLGNSPAARAGLRVGDKLTEINGTAMDRLDPHERRGFLQGAQEDFLVSVVRSGRKLQFRVTGRPVWLSNVEYALESARGRKRSVITVHSLKPAGVCQEVARLVLKAERRGVDHLILDLRGNPGGRVEEARCLAGIFLGPEVRVATVRRTALPHGLMPVTPARELGAPIEHLYTDRGKITDLPIDILVNGLTASSAEIFSAALQEHGRARVLGERTFGKGTMQTVFHPWDREDLHLHLTTHLVFTPLGRALQTEGVSPDVVVARN